jgi:hypothetical protein
MEETEDQKGLATGPVATALRFNPDGLTPESELLPPQVILA